MNNVAVRIENVHMKHQTIIADNRAYEHVPEHLYVEYTLTFGDVSEASGYMYFYNGGSETHGPISDLSFNDIHSLVSIRLGIYKESGDIK